TTEAQRTQRLHRENQNIQVSHDRDQRRLQLFVRVPNREIQFGFNVSSYRLKFLKIKQLVVQQVRRCGITERSQHRAAYIWDVFLELGNQTIDARPLQVGLRSAKV